MKGFLALSLAMFLIIPAFASATTGPDIVIRARDIRFSKDVLVAGDDVRLYATLENAGSVDISGYVAFFQGSVSLGTSQVVTLVANGLDEEVWVDFIVPVGPFNIRAEIRGTEPQDINPDNDLALTPLFTPVLDDDADGVVNDTDNCFEDTNEGQVDSDSDGFGDACDGDDDDDGLSDDIEGELGTNPINIDSDGDSVNDATDVFPLDSSKTKKEIVVATISPANTSAQVADVTSVPVSDDQFKSNDLTSDEDLTEINKEIAMFSGVEVNYKISPKAAFEYSQIDWKTYAFRVLASAGGASVIAWDFGDGVSSAQTSVDHAYQKFGTYQVTLTVSDAAGNTFSDSEEIKISFFHLANPIIKISIGALLLLLISSSVLAFKKSKRKISYSTKTKT